MRVTVIFIKEARSKGFLRIGIESDGKKYDFTVSEAEYSAAGSPLVRDKLFQDSFEILERADMKYRATVKALNILSYGDNSERKLKQKLLIAGFSADVADEVLRDMVSRGYINAQRQIRKLILNEVNLHFFGPMKIIPKLVAKGYSKSDVARVMEELQDEGEIDFESAKRHLLETKLAPNADEAEKKKLLYKNGYYVC